MKSLIRILGLVLLLLPAGFLSRQDARALASLEKTGRDLPYQIVQGMRLLRQLDMLGLGNGRQLAETDVVLISDLEEWLAASGYGKRLSEEELDKIRASAGFVAHVYPDGRPKPLPHLPVYFRTDSQLWKKHVSTLRVPPFNFESCVVAGMLTHELFHARGGSTSQAGANAAELRLILRLRGDGIFKGTREDEYISYLENRR